MVVLDRSPNPNRRRQRDRLRRILAEVTELKPHHVF